MTQPSDALLLLGQVGQLEVEAERTDERLHVAQVERLDRARQPLALLLGVLFAADGDRCPPHRFDQVESALALLLDDHLAEQRAEQLDLTRQRIARAGRADASWLGALGGIGHKTQASAVAGDVSGGGRSISR